MPSSYYKINFREFNHFLLLMIAIALYSSTMTFVLAVDQHISNNKSMEYSGGTIINKDMTLTALPLLGENLIDIAKNYGNRGRGDGGGTSSADVLVLIHHQETATAHHQYNNEAKNENGNVASTQMMHENFREFIELFGIKLNPLHVDFQFVDGKLTFVLIIIILFRSHISFNYPFIFILFFPFITNCRDSTIQPFNI